MSGRDFLLYGTNEKEPEARLLRAGPLSAEFINGNLRTISFGGVEVLRAVSYLVRDKDWGTYAPRLSNLQITEADDRFEVSFEAACEGQEGSALTLSASIIGEASRLTFDVTALPRPGLPHQPLWLLRAASDSRPRRFARHRRTRQWRIHPIAAS